MKIGDLITSKYKFGAWILTESEWITFLPGHWGVVVDTSKENTSIKKQLSSFHVGRRSFEVTCFIYKNEIAYAFSSSLKRVNTSSTKKRKRAR